MESEICSGGGPISPEEDLMEDSEEALVNNQEFGDADSVMENATSDLSSDSRGDEDDEDFNLTAYDERPDTREARR